MRVIAKKRNNTKRMGALRLLVEILHNDFVRALFSGTDRMQRGDGLKENTSSRACRSSEPHMHRSKRSSIRDAGELSVLLS